MKLNAAEMYNLAKNDEIQDYIKNNLYDPWIGSPFEGYRYMGNKQKGELGERLVTLIMEKAGYNVEFAHTSTAGYDRILNGIKTEIKFSVAHTDTKKRSIKKDCFTMNHVAVGKDWDRLIFIGVNENPNEFKAVYMTKEMFENCLKTDNHFNHQQGGKNSKNDDYMVTEKKLRELIQSEYVKELSEW